MRLIQYGWHSAVPGQEPASFTTQACVLQRPSQTSEEAADKSVPQGSAATSSPGYHGMVLFTMVASNSNHNTLQIEALLCLRDPNTATTNEQGL